MVNLILALTHSYSPIIYATVTYTVVLTLGLLTLVFSAQMQSPINIVTRATLQNANLDPLTFNNQYRVQVSGIFESTGTTTVRFVPNPNEPAAILTNHLGTYELQEVRFHWGSTPAKGSEHRVDSKQFAAEIHFVHLKQGASPSDTAGDTFSVVSVLCDYVSGMTTTGVWSDLNLSSPGAQPKPVSYIKYADLLPANLDYYQYRGSHTTSPHTENVQWFVAQNTIDIPGGFLTTLRQVQPSNYREVQNLNDRSVYEFSS